MSLTIAQQADLRIAVLEFLAQRFPLAYTADSIGRMLVRRQRIDYTPTSSDVTAACSFLKGENFADSIIDSLAILPSWQATSAGVTKFQRKHVEQNPAEGEL